MRYAPYVPPFLYIEKSRQPYGLGHAAQQSLSPQPDRFTIGLIENRYDRHLPISAQGCQTRSDDGGKYVVRNDLPSSPSASFPAETDLVQRTAQGRQSRHMDDAISTRRNNRLVRTEAFQRLRRDPSASTRTTSAKVRHTAKRASPP